MSRALRAKRVSRWAALCGLLLLAGCGANSDDPVSGRNDSWDSGLSEPAPASQLGQHDPREVRTGGTVDEQRRVANAAKGSHPKDDGRSERALGGSGVRVGYGKVEKQGIRGKVAYARRKIERRAGAAQSPIP